MLMTSILKWRSNTPLILLPILYLVLSGCQATRSTLPPTLIPDTPAPTQVVVALPLLMQSTPEASLTPMRVSTSTPTPAPVITPTGTPTERLIPNITLLVTGVIVPARR